MIKALKHEKERNSLRFFVNFVYTTLVFLLFLIICCILLNILGHNGDVKDSFIFNYRPTIIITGSMQPTIKINSIVMLEPVEFKDIQVGDIIRYTSTQGFSVLHRVIEKNEDSVITKGDNNKNQDSLPVTPEQITGRVTAIHNEYANLLTLIFGQFQYDNLTESVIRACLGLLIVVAFISLLIALFILIFETISTTTFFLTYKDRLVDSSSYWVEFVPDKEKQKEILENYHNAFKVANPLKKIVLAYRFRIYYNGLCNIERETRKEYNRIEKLKKSVK